MFSGNKQSWVKQSWVKQYGEKLVFVEAEGEETAAAETGDATESKEDKGSKKELDVKDMSPSQCISTIKAVIKACNDKMEDEEFADFMEKVQKAVDEYADEAEEEEDEEDEEK